MEKIGRHGDYTIKSSLQLERGPPGITIGHKINPKFRHESPKIKFCDGLPDGESLATYAALWQLYNDLPTDENGRAFIPSDKEGGARLILLRDRDMTVYIEDLNGKLGGEVLIRKNSPYFKKIVALFKAIEFDNKTKPHWNARALQP